MSADEVTLYQTEGGDLRGLDGRAYAVAPVDRLAALEAVAVAAEAFRMARAALSARSAAEWAHFHGGDGVLGCAYCAVHADGYQGRGCQWPGWAESNAAEIAVDDARLALDAALARLRALDAGGEA